MSKEKRFWNWFKRNEGKYFFLNQIDDVNEKERLLDEFLDQLHKYCNRLFFEIGGYPDGKQDLIITAEGDKDYFIYVETIVKSAPKLEYWNVIAFKPVRADFITEYKDISLDPSKIWFIPLNNNEDPGKIGLRLYSDNYNESNKIDFLTAAYIVLDNVLGEESNALNIDYVEMQTPSSSQKEEAIELNKLARYIQWWKSKK
jgi:hypothetical protein